MKRHLTLIALVFALVSGLAPLAHADSTADIKARMAARLSQVVALNQNGSAGENNLGYLTARKPLSEADAKVLAAENADRKAVYQMIAKKTKSSATSVGKTRAASIRKSAPKGTWVQLASGAWKQV